MNPGRLRQRVTLQATTQVRDGAGGWTEGWADVATVWAQVKPTGQREPVVADQLRGQVSHRITIRYRPGVTTGQRVLYRGRTLDVKGVANVDEAGKFLVLDCLEGE